ncbi:hypothetical protein ARTHRO_12088 [Limnospira indica PCC 8005]|uniref:Uncharacterized protein n=1 Tax=Limnospira indica PCC 8005 TaxID=376219 RepID=A0A9P1KF49_9CYAN|nr:hypothetical protein ARTHRO_12088 [Limnospira indica PCC 8005]
MIHPSYGCSFSVFNTSLIIDLGNVNKKAHFLVKSHHYPYRVLIEPLLLRFNLVVCCG